MGVSVCIFFVDFHSRQLAGTDWLVKDQLRDGDLKTRVMWLAVLDLWVPGLS